MTTLQRGIKYLAIALAVLLIAGIISGILGVAGQLSGLFSGDAVLEEVKTYPVSGDIRNLDIEIKAADLCIKEGEAFSVESNLKHLKVEEKGGLLRVRETGKFKSTYQGAVLTVCVPAGTVFDNLNLSTGAGRLTAARLSSGTVDFELGAGDVSIENLVVTGSADIEGGTGRITVGGGTLCNLDLEMGVGQLNLTSALTGNCSLDMGVGESNITLLGSREDYRLRLEKGIGSITVDGKPVTEPSPMGSGAVNVEINGGIGAINVVFQAVTEV